MILVNPSVQRMRNGTRNPKEYPFWEELISLLDDEVFQIGIKGDIKYVDNYFENLPLVGVKQLVKDCSYWITTDSFMPHLAHHFPKPGVVIFGPSDPKIYGYEENLNVLKNRSVLRPDQFGIWESCQFDENRFESAVQVAAKIKEWRFNAVKTINICPGD